MSEVAGAFSHLDEDALKSLAPRGVARSYAKGAVIVSEGDEAGPLYVVLSGRAKVYVNDEQGRELVLSVIEAGDYFGELVLDGGGRAASVMTIEPSRLFVVPGGEFENLVMHNAQFARDLINRLIGRLRRMNGMVKDLALKDVYGRFVRFIETNSIDMGGTRVVPEPLTQHEIAARIGGSREMVSRIVKDLTAGGYISVGAKYIKIHKNLPAHW